MTSVTRLLIDFIIEYQYSTNNFESVSEAFSLEINNLINLYALY